MPISDLFSRRRYEAPARALYETIVLQARRPEFYAAGGIPDNIPGRFDMIALHAWLVMRRLKASEADQSRTAGGLSQALFDLMFADMDQNLREMGVGDLSVGKKVKAMAQGFYGRVAAYDVGLAGGPAVLAEALRRNLFATGSPDEAQVTAMAAYLSEANLRLAAQPTARLLAGEAAFPEPQAI